MKKFLRSGVAVVLLMLPALVVGELWAAPAATTQPAPPAVGDKATDFSLSTLEGKEVKLSELLKTGPVVVVQLRGWVGYQCPICRTQVADLAAHAKDFAAAGARVVLVYPGPNEKLAEHAKDFQQGKGLPENFFFVLDPDLKFVNEWHLRWDKKGETAYPSTFIVDKDDAITYAKISHTHGDRANAGDLLKVLKP